MICYLYSEPSFVFFTTDLPSLLYYSHIPAALISLLVGLFIYINGRNLLLNKLLFLICTFFSTWCVANLFLWTNIHSDILLFLWPFLGVSIGFISVLSIYYSLVFIKKQDVGIKHKLLFLFLLAPLLIFAYTDISVYGFNLTNCDAFGYEGELFKLYYTLLSILGILWVPIIMFRGYFKADKLEKRKILIMGIGLQFFLTLFLSVTIIASYLTDLEIVSDARLEFFGLFGMIIFICFIAFHIIQFKSFNINTVASNVLVVALMVLTTSQLTFNDSVTSTILTLVTIIFTTLIGMILIRSVGREVKQREEIEKLAVGLEKANERLKFLDKQKSEFVSIASHQLRSPLTAIRGYVSMMQEGSFGVIPSKGIEALDRVQESAKFMASSINDFLEVSRIESGNMKYDYSDVNLREQAEHIVEDLRSDSIKRGLLLLFKSNMQSKGYVHADSGKTQQILHNLINNALKYTPRGTVTVYVHDDLKTKKMIIDVIDTGLGMSHETTEKLFAKFTRANIASSANIMGTGLGLFVAREMCRAMGGDITCDSKGEGKGSTFTITMPLIA